MISTLSSNIFALILIILQILGPYIFGIFPISTVMQLALSEIIFLFIPAILYIFFTKQSFIKAFSIKVINFKTILLLIVFAIVIQPSMGLLSAISTLLFPNNVSDFITGLNTMPFMLSLFIIAISPAISEEFAFRGAFASGYANIDIRKAAFMNGLMFAFLHLNGQQFLYAFAMGVLFAYIVYITGSIFSTILVHFIFNGSQMMLSRILSSASNIADSASQMTLDMSDSQLLYITFVVYGFLTFITIPIVYLIFKLLIKVNNNKFVDVNYNSLSDSKTDHLFNKESIFNWPIIAIIIIYVLIVILPLLLK